MVDTVCASVVVSSNTVVSCRWYVTFPHTEPLTDKLFHLIIMCFKPGCPGKILGALSVPIHEFKFKYQNVMIQKQSIQQLFME